MPLSKIEVQNGNDELTFDGGMVTIGGRTGVDVVLRDPMVADRHCVITHEDGFMLRDTGSVTGTWVDGKRAAPSIELVDGATIIIGTTRLTVTVGDDDGTQTLQLKSDPQSFWWKKAGKGAFDNDPDQLVYAETKFGRFPALHLGNRAAMIAGTVVLLAATFVSSIMEPLADPGPLMAPHQYVTTADLSDPPEDVAASPGSPAAAHSGFLSKCAQLSGEQGCNVCHTTGSGTPEQKCAQCHGLEGEMAHKGSWRHPYHNNGEVADQQFCVLCHTDHNGGTDRKAGTDDLIGNCATCHDLSDPDFQKQRDDAQIQLPDPQPVAFEDLNFPHNAHLKQEIGCDVCHQIDGQVRSNVEAGLPDDKNQHDFATVPYEVCASCHVEDAAATNMTAAQQTEWRAKAKDAQWSVGWHGTDDPQSKCLDCHAQTQRGGATVIGPEMKTVQRGVFSADLYRRERALYTNATRSHQDEFQKHAGDQKCSECHLDEKVRTATPTSRPARPFWHGLHLAAGALAPGDRAGQVSKDNLQGCISCHRDLGQPEADHLTPFTSDTAAYHWPESPSAQAACKECHKEGEELLPLLAAKRPTTAATERRNDFPHDIHVMSGAFGQSGTLAKGCFSCHEFSEADGEAPFTQVPRTLPGAMDCISCHQGHDNIAGGDCQQCHPKDERRSNSFLWQAKITEPQSTRPWPAANGFSHLSEGHIDHLKDCQTCHGTSGLEEAKTLVDVRVPDEREKLCRECHLEKQFHWR